MDILSGPVLFFLGVGICDSKPSWMVTVSLHISHCIGPAARRSPSPPRRDASGRALPPPPPPRDAYSPLVRIAGWRAHAPAVASLVVRLLQRLQAYEALARCGLGEKWRGADVRSGPRPHNNVRCSLTEASGPTLLMDPSICTSRFGAVSAKLVTTVAASVAPALPTSDSAAEKLTVAATAGHAAVDTAAPPPQPERPVAAAAAPSAPALSVIDAFQALRDGVTCLSEIPALCMEAVPRDRLPPSGGGESSSKSQGLRCQHLAIPSAMHLCASALCLLVSLRTGWLVRALTLISACPRGYRMGNGEGEGSALNS